VEGQGGTDALDFDGSNAPENIDVSANGPRVRFFRDVANVLMDLNGIETLNVKALGGADTVTVNNLTGTALKTANVDLASPFGPGSGDGAADTVIANATSGADNVNVSSSGGGLVVSGLAAKVQVTGAEASLDHVAVNALDGDDTITSGVGVSGPQSVNIDGGPGTDTTTYSGTSAADAIGIALNGTSVATFTGGPPNSVVNSASVENLVVKGLAGADTIIGQNGIAGLTNLTIDGGPGDDTLTGGDGNDTLIGGDGNDVVDGARGADAALLGAGDDTFVWNPGDQSDTVEGQGGRDTMQFNGSNAPENIDVSANGSRVRLFRDVSGITQDLNGIEAMNIDSLGGTDSITVNDMTGTALKAVALDLGFPPGSGTGDGAPDSVIINGSPGPDHVLVTRSGSQVLTTGLAVHTSITGSEPANDSLHVNTLGGRDTVSVAPDVSTLIAPFVDLGADQ
jgi:Ca2+-binding RTX toxin-like protein